MSDDLDEFLKQAAERRRQRQQQKSERPPISKAPPPIIEPPPVLSQQIPTLRPEMPDVFGSAQTSSTSGEAFEVGAGAEDTTRFESRLKSQFDREAPKTKIQSKKSKKSQSSSPAETPTLEATTSSIAPSMPVAVPNSNSSTRIADQLRNPQTLRNAIIVHEILKRPWQ